MSGHLTDQVGPVVAEEFEGWLKVQTRWTISTWTPSFRKQWLQSFTFQTASQHKLETTEVQKKVQAYFLSKKQFGESDKFYRWLKKNEADYPLFKSRQV